MTDPLDILLPNRTLNIAGKTVVVHEYTLVEQLQHRPQLKVIADGFRDAMLATPNADVQLNTLWDVLGENWQAVLAVVAVSCDESIEFISGLTTNDANDLLMTWWGVNANFFTKEVIRPKVAQIIKDNQSLLTSELLSPASSPMGTTPAPLSTTPPDSSHSTTTKRASEN